MSVVPQYSCTSSSSTSSSDDEVFYNRRAIMNVFHSMKDVRAALKGTRFAKAVPPACPPSSAPGKTMFAALEGIDGVGKTTMRRRLGACGYRAVSAPIDVRDARFRTLRPEYDAAPERTRRAMYAAGNYWALEGGEGESDGAPFTVCDRFAASSIAYAIAMDPTIPCLDALPDWEFEWPVDLAKPTVTLYLVCDEGARGARVTARPDIMTAEEHALQAKAALRDRLLAAYERVFAVNHLHVVRIDTTRQRPEAVATQCQDALKAAGMPPGGEPAGVLVCTVV